MSLSIIPSPAIRGNTTNPQPTPASIVPGNHNLIVFFYTKDAFTGRIRISEDYTTPKTYSAVANTVEEALEKCRQWAERKVEDKSHFMKGFRIEKLFTAPLLDFAPIGVTFEEAAAKPITSGCPTRRPQARALWNIDNC